MPERLSVSEFKAKYDGYTKEDRKLYKKIRDEEDNLKYFEDTFKEDADIVGQPWWKDLKQKREDLEKESYERTDEWNNTDKNDKEKSDEVYARYAETMKKLDEVTRQIDKEAKEHKDQTVKLIEERLADKYDMALAGANYNLEQIDEETKQINEEANAQIEKINKRINVVQNRLQENLKFMQNLDRDSDDFKKRNRIVEKYNNELKDKLWPEFKNINQEKDKKIAQLGIEKDEYTRVKGAICKVLDYLGKKKVADKDQKVGNEDAKKAQGQKLADTLGAAAAKKQEDNDKAAPVAKQKTQPVKRPIPVNRKTEKVEPTSKAKIEINAEYGNVHFQPKDSEARFTDDISEYFGKGKAKEVKKACFEYLKEKYGEKKLISRFDLRGLNPAILSFLLEFDDINNDELLYKYVYDKKNLPLEYIASIENPDTSKLDDKTFIRLNRQILRDNKYFGTNFKAIPFLGLKTFFSKIPGLRNLQSSENAVKMLPSAIRQREAEKQDKEAEDTFKEAVEQLRNDKGLDTDVDRFFKILYPDVSKLSPEEAEKAAYDKTIIEENIEFLRKGDKLWNYAKDPETLAVMIADQKADKYGEMLYPEIKNLEDGINATEDKLFIRMNIDKVDKEYLDCLKRRDEIKLTDQELMRDIVSGLKADELFKILHPEYDKLPAAEQLRLMKDQRFIDENVEELYKEYSGCKMPDSQAQKDGLTDQEIVAKAIANMKSNKEKEDDFIKRITVRTKEDDELFEDMLNVEIVNTEEDRFYNIVNGKELEDGDEPIEIPMEEFLKDKDEDDGSR